MAANFSFSFLSSTLFAILNKQVKLSSWNDCEVVVFKIIDDVFPGVAIVAALVNSLVLVIRSVALYCWFERVVADVSNGLVCLVARQPTPLRP